MSKPVKRKAEGSILQFFIKQKKNSVTENNEPQPKLPVESIVPVEAPVPECEIAVSATTKTILLPNDISNFVKKSMSNAEKVERFKNIWTPPVTFTFPFSEQNKRKLKFQLRWFNSWKWLVYSSFEDGVFCKYCVFFNDSSSKNCLVKFCLEKFSNWNKAVETFNHHEKSTVHKLCVERSHDIFQIEERVVDSIHIQLDKNIKSQAAKNRMALEPIIETILFCGRQGLPLRGHRDSGPIELEDITSSQGNFRELLKYRCKTDENLKNHLELGAKNAQYVSPVIQNEVLEVNNKIILEVLVKKINKAGFFSIMADETADISTVEQLSICIRYFDDNSKTINEHFIQFVPITDCSGKGIADTILQKLVEWEIDITQCRGQGYDGASAMSGKFNGVQTHIREKIPSALYVHCSAHVLNLALAKSCTVSPIRNCIGTINYYVYT